MTRAEMLVLLKQSIGEPCATDNREAFIGLKLDSAITRLETEGISFTPTTSSGGELSYPIEDSDLILTLAEFLIRKRDTDNGYPRSLEWAIHNRKVNQVGDNNV